MNQFNIVNLKDSVQVWFGTKVFAFDKQGHNPEMVRETLQEYLQSKSWPARETKEIVNRTLRCFKPKP